MKADHLDFGRNGEAKALAFLERKGLRLLAKNYRTCNGEVDLVFRDGNQIVFVEVKARRSTAFGDGAEAVGPQKMRKIVKTAMIFLQSNHLENASYRFDVVSILSGKEERITHIPYAFP